MPPSYLEVGIGEDMSNSQTGLETPTAAGRPPEPKYQLTQFDTPFILVSLFRQIRRVLREPKVTVPPKYYRGEATLPITEMRAWYRDIPNIIKAGLEKSTHPVDIYNRAQEKKRALVAVGVALVAAVAGWILKRDLGVVLGLIGGIAVGRVFAVLLYKKQAYPPDMWRDYRMQQASWVNSVLVHGVVLAAMVLPIYIARLLEPAKAAPTVTKIVDISPYMPELPADAKKAGGGGGGGDRSPTPASKGSIPKFSKVQLAPPMAKIPNLTPKMPVQPSLLGPPELKLPEMATNLPWGDPKGVPGPPSNGPGTGGGIGSGEGTGIGSGSGGGLGPGSGGGTGGGAYTVGGNVSAPIPIYKPEPPYSEEARKAKYQGTVVLWIVVDAQGNVTDARVVKPLGLGLDEKAVETVRTWKFKPAMRSGTPVPVKVMVEVSFRLF
ncbi:MAG TPA: TonB family protein [Terriglobia bacterium]|nr:TonB family protein [Terriglobia bacterium]